MKTSTAKAKGREGQKEVIKLLEKFYCNLKGHFINRSMGSQGDDVILSPAAKLKFPFSIEVKRRRTIGLIRWIEQAKANSDFISTGATPLGMAPIRAEGKFLYTQPLLFFREDCKKGEKKKWYVALEAETFLGMVSNVS